MRQRSSKKKAATGGRPLDPCRAQVMRRKNNVRKNYFLNHGPFASSEKMARLAINPNWTCNIHDPRNAHYLRPLSIVADEKMANEMSAVTYGAVAEQHANDLSFNPDYVYRQCLVDARRMLRDREYWALFSSEDDFTPALQ